MAERFRGVPEHLLSTSTPSPGRAIPAADEGVIRAAEEDGLEAAQAGAEGRPQDPATAPGSQSTIPEPHRSAIVPPEKFHVP
jgi:hypothetical protein